MRARFRPCIDLHEGQVKQIVGGTLDSDSEELRTNFVSERPPRWYAERYAEDELRGGHVIKLGPGNDEAAAEALAAFPGGLQVGGGIRADNAAKWLERGASHVIATSFLFDSDGRFLESNLDKLVTEVGRERLVIDLSCRRDGDGWRVAMNRWQTLTELPLSSASLDNLSSSCAEFLIHAADVEGKCEGVDRELVSLLGSWANTPVTYAGGARHLDDFRLVDEVGRGRVDLTIGSALDIFGGDGARYADCVAFHRGEIP